MTDHTDHSPARRYTFELAARVSTSLGLSRKGITDREVQCILEMALHEAHLDVVSGRFVSLEHIGEFVKVDNHGPCIRYQADRKLIQDCCIRNLKTKGGH